MAPGGFPVEVELFLKTFISAPHPSAYPQDTGTGFPERDAHSRPFHQIDWAGGEIRSVDLCSLEADGSSTPSQLSGIRGFFLCK